MPYRTSAAPPPPPWIVYWLTRLGSALWVVVRWMLTIAIARPAELFFGEDTIQAGHFRYGMVFAVCLGCATALTGHWLFDEPDFDKPLAKNCGVVEYECVEQTYDSPLEATPEQQEEHAQTCETVCIHAGMWPIASNLEIEMPGWSTCTCIESAPRGDRPRVVVFQGAHFERSQVLFEGRP